jgi:hypothetical protein
LAANVLHFHMCTVAFPSSSSFRFLSTRLFKSNGKGYHSQCPIIRSPKAVCHSAPSTPDSGSGFAVVARGVLLEWESVFMDHSFFEISQVHRSNELFRNNSDISKSRIFQETEFFRTNSNSGKLRDFKSSAVLSDRWCMKMDSRDVTLVKLRTETLSAIS